MGQGASFRPYWESIKQDTRQIAIDDLVQEIKAGHFNVNYAEEDGKTALHWASNHGNRQLVLALIECGADVNSRDSQHCSPLHLAVYNGHASSADVLLSHKADPNVEDSQKMTPLHWAVKCNQLACIDVLLRHGASPQAQDRDGRTPSDLLSSIKPKSKRIILQQHWDACVSQQQTRAHSLASSSFSYGALNGAGSKDSSLSSASFSSLSSELTSGVNMSTLAGVMEARVRLSWIVCCCKVWETAWLMHPSLAHTEARKAWEKTLESTLTDMRKCRNTKGMIDCLSSLVSSLHDGNSYIFSDSSRSPRTFSSLSSNPFSSFPFVVKKEEYGFLHTYGVEPKASTISNPTDTSVSSVTAATTSSSPSSSTSSSSSVPSSSSVSSSSSSSSPSSSTSNGDVLLSSRKLSLLDFSRPERFSSFSDVHEIRTAALGAFTRALSQLQASHTRQPFRARPTSLCKI